MEIYSRPPSIFFNKRLKIREKNGVQPQDSDDSGKSPSAQEYDNSRKIEKSNTVRIVHRGGFVEIFHQPLSARTLMEAYPDHVVTSPDVFQRPREAVVNSDAVLMPGQTFYLLSRKGIHKLLCKQRMKQNNKTELSISKELPASKKPKIVASAMTYVTQFFSSAKEFYGHGHDHKFRDRTSGLWEVSESQQLEDSGSENGEEQRKRHAWQFVPTLHYCEFYRDFPWRPTLPVIQELSP